MKDQGDWLRTFVDNNLKSSDKPNDSMVRVVNKAYAEGGGALQEAIDDHLSYTASMPMDLSTTRACIDSVIDIEVRGWGNDKLGQEISQLDDPEDFGEKINALLSQVASEQELDPRDALKKKFYEAMRKNLNFRQREKNERKQ